MYQVSISGASLTELKDNIQIILSDLNGSGTAQTKSESTSKKKTSKKDVITGRPPKTEQQKIENVIVKSALDYTKENIQKALQSVNVTCGIEEARNILAEFGANKMSDLEQESYADFVSLCEEKVDAKLKR